MKMLSSISLSKVRFQLFFLTFVGFYACVTPIDIDIENNTNNLIVDAELTNEAGPYMVRLTTSESFNSPPPVSGASIWITDDLGNRLDFMEIEEGEYQSDPESSFNGQVGRTYVLHIETPDGVIVESNPETMIEVPEIQTLSVFPAQRVRISDLGNEIITEGFEVRLNTQSLGDQSTFLRFDYRGVYIVKTPNPTLRNITCFILDNPPREYLNVFGTTIQNEVPILNIPIEFFRPTFKFDTLYFLLTRQFSLNEDAFGYWSQVDQQRNGTGSIFDPTPSSINNNLRDLNNPENEILGYFTVSAIDETTFEIFRSDIERFNLRFEVPFTECFLGSPPDFCDSCALLTNSSLLFPEVVW